MGELRDAIAARRLAAFAASFAADRGRIAAERE
jgi:hypothetical protein